MVEDFYNHHLKHKLGINLLPEEARKIIRVRLKLLSEKWFEEEEVTIDEEFRLIDFYVDYHGGWGFPRP